MRRRCPPILAALAILATAVVGVAGAPGSSAVPVAAPMGTYQNPIYPNDFPDPFVFNDNGTFVAIATNANGPNIQIVTSRDLKNWVLHRDALPELPSWAVPGKTWAPSMVKTTAGYILYYTARHRSGIHCIGRASGPTAIGPFKDVAAHPLVCQGGSRRGSIDPSPFRDEYGRPWLLWKSEGTPGVEPTRIWSRPMRLDGLEFDGPTFHLLQTSQPWEGPIIENPSMQRIAGKLFLFYSGGRWEDGSYAINYAECAGIGGPCTKAPGPWVRTTDHVAGPGAQEFFRANGALWMSYHAWNARAVGYPQGIRTLRIDRVVAQNGRPVLYGPTHTQVPFGS